MRAENIDTGGTIMKYVLISLSESSKIDFSGAEKLSKTDHIVFLYVKGKKTLPASVKSALEDVVAEIEYFEMASASELIPCASYLIGYHEASKHDVIVITEDKSKLPSKVTKDIKVYSAFKSIAGTSSTSKKTTTAKKTTTTKKAATTKKTSTAKKTSTTKKSTTKKASSSKKKNDDLDVSDIFNTIVKKLF